ncbi:MAG: aminotransferase, partial [Eggerthellaceae bacterium]|nr:aminotransferase [Eggerthellaceae bacterium]
EKFSKYLTEVPGVSWSKPNGGYFILLKVPQGLAKTVVAMAKEVGVSLTKAGATWPYGQDPFDTDIRIAPTVPSLEELSVALDVLTCCVKLAYLRTL